MKVVVFVTDNRVGELKPTLFLPDYPPAAIPPHPAGRVWRYLATVDHQDALLDADRADIEDALSRGEPFVAPGAIA